MTQRDIETAALLYANEKFPPKIGTIGGGGHYAEVDLNEENCKQCYRHFLDGYQLSLERIAELEKEIKELSEGIDAIASKLSESEELCEQYQRDMEK